MSYKNIYREYLLAGIVIGFKPSQILSEKTHKRHADHSNVFLGFDEILDIL